MVAGYFGQYQMSYFGELSVERKCRGRRCVRHCNNPLADALLFSFPFVVFLVHYYSSQIPIA